MKVKIIKGIYWGISFFLLLFGIEAIQSSYPFRLVLETFFLQYWRILLLWVF